MNYMLFRLLETWFHTVVMDDVNAAEHTDTLSLYVMCAANRCLFTHRTATLELTWSFEAIFYVFTMTLCLSANCKLSFGAVQKGHIRGLWELFLSKLTACERMVISVSFIRMWLVFVWLLWDFRHKTPKITRHKWISILSLQSLHLIWEVIKWLFWYT